MSSVIFFLQMIYTHIDSRRIIEDWLTIPGQDKFKQRAIDSHYDFAIISPMLIDVYVVSGIVMCELNLSNKVRN